MYVGLCCTESNYRLEHFPIHHRLLEVMEGEVLKMHLPCALHGKREREKDFGCHFNRIV